MIEGLVTWGPKFELRFAMLNSTMITNKISPELICGANGTAEEYISQHNERNGFYDKLEKSILNDGFRNPILVVAGWAPSKVDPRFPARMAKKGIDVKEALEDHTNEIYCLTNGGSRLWIATKHRLQIPCIISDYVGRFKAAPLISSVDEVLNYYRDEPDAIVFGSKGIAVRNLPHTHLEE